MGISSSTNAATTSLLSVIMASSFHCNAESDYFPPPESEGGWRSNTDPDFARSLGLEPSKRLLN